MLNKFYSYFNTPSQFFKILTVFYYIDIVLIIISTKRTFLHFESSLNFEVVCSKSIPYVNQFTGYKIEFLLFIHVISYTICDMYNSFNSNECFFESKFHMVPHFFFNNGHLVQKNKTTSTHIYSSNKLCERAEKLKCRRKRHTNRKGRFSCEHIKK